MCIRDSCNNFEYFRVNPHGKDSGFIETLAEKIFLCKARIVRELQDTDYQKDEDFREYRNTLVKELMQAISDLNDKSFIAVSYTHLKRTEQSFFVPKEEIVENDYDLSINKYKEIEYIPVEYPPTEEILKDIEELEVEIHKNLVELRKMLEENDD